MQLRGNATCPKIELRRYFCLSPVDKDVAWDTARKVRNCFEMPVLAESPSVIHRILSHSLHLIYSCIYCDLGPAFDLAPNYAAWLRMSELRPEKHSTLEVDDSRLPEIEQQNLPEPIFPNEYPKCPEYGPDAAPLPPGLAKRSRTICGLRKRTFWIVFAIAFILAEAAIIGGAVG